MQTQSPQMKFLRPLFLFVDLGFIVYWSITYLKLIPAELLFPDYHNELLVIWNWSFFPLDILISITGITSLILFRRGVALWKPLALVSLVLTSVSGLQAIAFWSIQGWFDWSWWLPNLFLLIYPLCFIPQFIRELATQHRAD